MWIGILPLWRLYFVSSTILKMPTFYAYIFLLKFVVKHYINRYSWTLESIFWVLKTGTGTRT